MGKWPREGIGLLSPRTALWPWGEAGGLLSWQICPGEGSRGRSGPGTAAKDPPPQLGVSWGEADLGGVKLSG